MSDGEMKREDLWGPETRWTAILNAAGGADPRAVNDAWKVLLERYREPVRASLKRHAPGEDLDEMFAGFFAYVFDRRALARADKSRGRFRCFLQGVLKNYVREHRRARGREVADIEDMPIAAPHEAPAVEIEEETAWAVAYLKQALIEFRKKNARDAHILMASTGVFGTPVMSSTELAEHHGMQENAIYQARKRAKDTLRTYLTAVVATATDGPADTIEENELISVRLMSAFPGLCD